MTMPQGGHTTGAYQADRPDVSGTSASAFDNDRRDVSEASVGALIGEVTNDLSTLMRQELDLAKAELRQEAAKTGKAAGLLGGAGLAGYMVALFVSIALWWALANGMDEGWAALIVAAIWAVVAAVLFSIGRKRMRDVNPKPERTVETLKEVPDALKGR
jgi:hypothetical protein